MAPSPSLGPPLLSASWSPPLFCGIPAVELAAPESDPPCEAEGGAADPAGEALPLYPPPQPAAASATVARTATPANARCDLRTARLKLLRRRAIDLMMDMVLSFLEPSWPRETGCCGEPC